MPSGSGPFDPYAAPLRGVNLIEASAGTGKTWTITLLYLRLLVEGNLRVDEILTVTYTKAATAELKQRTRDLLEKMRRALDTGEVPPGDSLVGELKSRFSGRPEAHDKIARALRDFDQAAIFTIHSFCQRVLSEQPLESGGSLDAEVQPDESLLLRETADDFWRLRVVHLDPLAARYLLDRKATPESLLKGVRSYLNKPHLELPPTSACPVDGLLDAYRRAWEVARDAWKGPARDGMEAFLVKSPDLDRNKYREKSMPQLIARTDAFLGPDAIPRVLCTEDDTDALQRITSGKLGKSLKKDHTPELPAFSTTAEELRKAHDALATALDQWHLELHVELLRYLTSELPKKKERLRVMSYGDLLTRLRDALDRDPTLAGKVAENYRAALIDEFQDTDPVQYDIFRKIFVEPGQTVFLVGDPKQAIFSFRGADVFTYLQAREAVTKPLPLVGNRRSTKPMVDAVNRLFGRRQDAFVLDRIPFHPSDCRTDPSERLAAPDEDRPPCRIWFIGGDVKNDKKGEEPLRKTAARKLAVEATAAEIVRLLGAGDRKEITVPRRDGARFLRGSDIAVLVPTHALGTMVRKRLRRLGVACVQHSQANVFESEEARDVECLLRAIAEPGREDLVRAALVTDLLGLSGRELYDLGLDEQKWGETLAGFQECHNRWLRRGFMPMFRRLVQDRGVAARLLAWSDGERRLTNVHHLAELLHAASAAIGRAPDRMVEWLAVKRAEEGQSEEEALLRLESDEQVVNIVTVHSSKGLQYPVVFIPFASDVRDPRYKPVGITWHDPDMGFKERLDIAPQGEVRAAAENEQLAGRVRELYVAVTRARFRCYLVHGHVNGADGSALRHLLDSHPGKEVLEELAAGSKGSLSVDPIPREEAGKYSPSEGSTGTCDARAFPRARVDQAWRVTSYSGLTAGAKEAPVAPFEELPDHDQQAVEQPEAEEQSGPQIPRGARIGSCLHSIFEELDFTEAGEARLKELAAARLLGFGFPEDLSGPVAELVTAALDTPLDAGGSIRLRGLDSRHRLNEMGFFYPVEAVDAAGLLRVLREQGLRVEFLTALERVDFDTLTGFMKGFIDLVFEAGGRYYLADYKSNRLAGYGQAELTAEMAHSFYFLQYLLYTVALHRYLGARLPGYDYDRHFGGVFYLFLRGMDAARPGSGVFADRPSGALVEALDSSLGRKRP